MSPRRKKIKKRAASEPIKNTLLSSATKQHKIAETPALKSEIGIIFLSLLIVIIATILVYSNSFHGEFLLDDRQNILHNSQIRNLANLKEVIRNIDRPVAMIVNAINYHFWKTDVFGYHLFNIIIHIFTSILLYFVVRNTLEMPVIKVKYSENKNLISFFTALIFAVHPIQTQAVTYIIQGRMAALAAMFYLSALLFFILGTKAQRHKGTEKIADCGLRIADKNSNNQQLTTNNNPKASAVSRSLSSIPYPLSPIFYLLSVLSSALGMGVKEPMITAPVMIFLYDLFFISQPKGQTLNLSIHSELRKRIPIHIMLFSTTGIMLYFVLTCNRFGSSAGFGVKDFSPIQYLFTQFGVVLYYIYLLICPIRQNLDYNWYVANSFFELQVIIPFITILLILYFAYWIYRKNKLITFCILWYFITLLPESSIIPIKDVIFEHRIYLPSVGFIFLAVSSIFQFRKIEKQGKG